MTPSFQCRACGSRHGTLVLDLGLQPLANNLLRPEDLAKPEPRFPLRLFVCNECWLMQIADLVPPVELFSEYLYFSSFSDAWVQHARQTVSRYLAEFNLGPQSHVVEIASNDGYLLQNFVRAGVPCLGIEPAANIAKVAREKGIETLIEFFGVPIARELASQNRQADLILGNNVFAHAPDINDFVGGMALLLKPGGRIVLEFPYGMDFVEKTEFDTIYHEHVFYFTLTPLVPLFRRHGLEILRVESIPMHGGSLRLFAGKPADHPVQASIAERLACEAERGVLRPGYYSSFTEQVARVRAELLALLANSKRQGRRLAAYGASAKGSTLLNYCGIGADTLDFVADRSTYKQGRLTPGTHLPIVEPGQLLARQPDDTLLLTWNFADEILAQQHTYRERGGRFIIPLPRPRIV